MAKKLTRLEFYTLKLQRQKEWIKSCGGDLSGYILNYGDPGVLTADGKPMFGDGGTMIYQADMAALRRDEELLADAKRAAR